MYCLLPKQSTRQKFPSVFCFKKQRNIRKRKELCMKSTPLLETSARGQIISRETPNRLS
jgi:hypothetical protein